MRRRVCCEHTICGEGGECNSSSGQDSLALCACACSVCILSGPRWALHKRLKHYNAECMFLLSSFPSKTQWHTRAAKSQLSVISAYLDGGGSRGGRAPYGTFGCDGVRGTQRDVGHYRRRSSHGINQSTTVLFLAPKRGSILCNANRDDGSSCARCVQYHCAHRDRPCCASGSLLRHRSCLRILCRRASFFCGNEKGLDFFSLYGRTTLNENVGTALSMLC